MSEEISLKLVSAITKIKNFTTQFPNTKFYIGKTDNLQRREQEHLLEGYKNIKPIADTSSIDDLNELIPVKEWMRICHELIDTFKAHRKSIRRVTVNAFGYIAKAVGPQEVLITLLNNLINFVRQCY